MMKLVREHINEKFTEDSDPIHDMGIGITRKIKKWLAKMNITNYTINDDLSIDVDGYVNLNRKLNNGKLPDYIQFGKIKNGYFSIEHNNLISLKGSPRYINGGPQAPYSGDFICSYNKLTSLMFAPKKISGTFICHYNTKQFSESEIKRRTIVGKFVKNKI